MLTAVRLRNFGAVGPGGVDLRLGRVTVLAGPNGVGKSTLLRAPAVLAQTAGSFDRLGLLHDGDRARFSSYEDMCFGLDVEADLELGVDIDIPVDDLRSYAALPIGGGVIPAGRVAFDDAGKPVRLAYRCISRRLRHFWAVSQKIAVGRREAVSAHAVRGSQADRSLEIDGKAIGQPSDSPEKIFNPGAFQATEAGESTFAVAAAAVRAYLWKNVRPVEAVRGAATFQEEAKTEASPRTGPHGRWTLHWINEQAQNDPQGERLLVGWLERLGLRGFKVGTQATKMSAKFEDAISRARLPIYLAGYGHQQIVPFLAELAFATRDVVVTVEEPENSLHPAAQVELVGVITEAVRERGAQVFMSTQSPTLALGFCRAVRRGQESFQREHLSLWQVERGKSGTEVQHLEVDAKGIVHPRWFSTFAKAEADLLREFAVETDDGTPKETRARAGRARSRR